MLDIFIDRFQGRWSNFTQATNNPRSASLVYVTHEYTGDGFVCSYTRGRQKNPYRYFEASLYTYDGNTILRNPIHDIIFHMEGGAYITKAEFESNGIRYINEAYLGEKHYHVKDQGFRIETGQQLWGLPDGEFYEFRRC